MCIFSYFNTWPTARATENCQNGEISPIGRLSVNSTFKEKLNSHSEPEIFIFLRVLVFNSPFNKIIWAQSGLKESPSFNPVPIFLFKGSKGLLHRMISVQLAPHVKSGPHVSSSYYHHILAPMSHKIPPSLNLENIFL